MSYTPPVIHAPKKYPRSAQGKARQAQTHRLKYLAIQLPATRLKLKHLIREAKEAGLIELLTNEEWYEGK